MSGGEEVFLIHNQERISLGLFALAAKWGMKKCCRLVDVSYNDTLKLKGLGGSPFYKVCKGNKGHGPSRSALGRKWKEFETKRC